ncbi:TonB-dependent receptor [Dysgonomonas sp. OttesenSCG-928-D17]|nr:TonB-dependent receptor [Dysgonomonas sp. OttesenSCG-928-D17]
MNYRLTHLLILFLSTISVSVSADDVPTIDSDSVILRYTANEVVIESFKQNDKLLVEPIAATLLSAKELKEYNILNIKEVTALVPNLYMPDYGSKMTSPVFIRGIGASKNAPSVGLYVDGVPYFDRSTFDFNINDIERIEVLRGPQGTIYGRNTMGGIINVFTRSPFKYTGTHLNLSAGNHNNYSTGVSHYGNVNNKFGYAVSGNYMHSGGYFENKYTEKKADPIDAISARARLSWRIQPRLTAHLVMAYEYSDQDGYPYRIYDKETGAIEDVNYNIPSFYRRNMSTNGLNIEYVTDSYKLGSQTSFQFFDGKQGLDQDFSPKDNLYVDFYHRQQMYSQEFNIRSIKEDSRYQWQFGLFGFYQNYFQTNDVDNRTTGEHKHTLQDVHNPSGGFAAYHQSVINDIFIPNLSLLLGVRYDWEKTKSTFERITPTTVDDPMKDKLSFSQVTPKGSIQYKFSNDGLAYFSVSRGYKTGGFNNTADKEVKEDRTFDPEHSWSYEVGARSGFFNNLLFLDLTLFYIDWKDQQITQPKTLSSGFILRNAGKTVSKGLEFSAQVNPLRNFNFQLSYGYTHAKYKDYKNGDIVYDKNYLPMIPQNTLSLAANYTIDVRQNWLDNIVLNGQYTGVGKLYWDDENDIMQSYYGLFNGQVSFVRKQVSVDLWMKNIGNKDYITYYFSTSTGRFVQKGKPFTCGINVNLKF